MVEDRTLVVERRAAAERILAEAREALPQFAAGQGHTMHMFNEPRLRLGAGFALDEEQENKRTARPRHIEAHTTYHILLDTTGDMFLLAPRPTKTSIINGVLGKALKLYPQVRLGLDSILSNHMHMLLWVDKPSLERSPLPELQSGNTFSIWVEHLWSMLSAYIISQFVGYFKREVSRRIRIYMKKNHRRKFNAIENERRVDAREQDTDGEWFPGSIWKQGFKSTALPDIEKLEEVVGYVLAQGVKEGLVARCVDWPGPHSGKVFATGAYESGLLFDGTGWSKAKHRNKHAKKKKDMAQEKLKFYKRSK